MNTKGFKLLLNIEYIKYLIFSPIHLATRYCIVNTIVNSLMKVRVMNRDRDLPPLIQDRNKVFKNDDLKYIRRNKYLRRINYTLLFIFPLLPCNLMRSGTCGEYPFVRKCPARGYHYAYIF